MTTAYNIKNSQNGVLYEDTVENVSLYIADTSAYVDFYDIQEPNAGCFEDMMTQAMNAPFNTPRLRDLARGKRTASIIVSDATRAVQTSMVLPYIIKELEAAGICLPDIKIVVAVGVHRCATEEEMGKIAGVYYGKILVENHTPFTKDNLVVLGKTTRGTVVEVNKHVYESDLKISIGKIEPHEFAGFSGGRKSVLPGISSEASIAHNHRPDMLLDKNSVSGILDDNPIHLDMLEAANMLHVDFTVNLVQNAKGIPIGVFAGDIEEAHIRGVEFIKENFGIRLKMNSNIYVVTPGYPLNIDLYQSIKALIALMPIVKKNDVIIFYSQCKEGVNSDDMLNPFRVSTNLDEILNFIVTNYKIQMDHALLLCKLYQKGVNIVACVPGVEDNVLSLLHMLPAENLNDALEVALKCKNTTCHAKDKIHLSIIPMPQRYIIHKTQNVVSINR